MATNVPAVPTRLPRKLPKANIVKVLRINANDLSVKFLTKEVLKIAFGTRYQLYIRKKVFYNEDVGIIITALGLCDDEIKEIIELS
jgi:hypothetical protein